MIKFTVSYPLLVFSFFFFSCANQLPPTGGPEDISPPVIVRTVPSDQSLNFTGRSIIIEFDDHIDRRSFQENFRITPRPPGEINFDWNSRSVEITFSRPLERNRTYIVTIGSGVRDLFGNILQEPLQFAFSTGPRLDEGIISGKVITDNPERVIVVAFIKTGKNENELNPENFRADYSTRINTSGNFSFSNLPDGEFRLFSISDANSNELYDKNSESIAVTFMDPVLSSNDNNISNVNFLLKEIEPDITGAEFSGYLTFDADNFIASNFFNQTEPISRDHRFYFYFRNNPFTKEEIIRGISLTDTITNQSYRLFYNWINDSLLEAFSIEDLPQGRILTLRINLPGHGINYLNEKTLAIAGVNDYSDISGEILIDDSVSEPVVLNLINKNNFNKYSLSRAGSGTFRFENIPPGEYTLFAFIDTNNNNTYDNGNYFPFLPSERFAFYEGDLRVRARWNIEDIILNF